MRPIRARAAMAGIAMLLAACTGGGSSASAGATQAAQEPSHAAASASASPEGSAEWTELMDAVEATIETGTARIEQSVAVEGSSLIDDFESDSFRGQASLGTDHRMYAVGDYTEMMGIGEIEIIVEGTSLYLGGELAKAITDEAEWVLVDLESDDPTVAPFLGLASGQNDLSMTVYYLLGMSPDVEVVSDDTGGGGPHRRFSGEIDLESARELIPAANAEALENVIATMRVGGMPRQFQGTAWVRDGTVNKVSFTFELGRQQGGGTLTSTVEFLDLGAPLDYDIPDEADVINIEDIDDLPPPPDA